VNNYFFPYFPQMQRSNSGKFLLWKCFEKLKKIDSTEFFHPVESKIPRKTFRGHKMYEKSAPDEFVKSRPKCSPNMYIYVPGMTVHTWE
jgi:hypothetical protein